MLTGCFPFLLNNSQDIFITLTEARFAKSFHTALLCLVKQPFVLISCWGTKQNVTLNKFNDQRHLNISYVEQV